MRFYQQPRFWVLAVVAALALVILYEFWQWEVERVEVPPGKFLVRIHRWGKDLAPGDIVAPDDSYKGVILDKEPWSEGRHWLNPAFWSYQIEDRVQVPPGKCLVLTRKFGEQLPPERLARGEILVAEDGPYCGIVAGYKPPGNYAYNPYAFSWKLVDAVHVSAGQVGVKTLKAGKDPHGLGPQDRPSPYVVPAGYRGIQQEFVPASDYYLNPYEATITPVDVQIHRVELTDIQFLSRDGFPIKPHIIVTYAVQPEKAAELLVRLSNEGLLHQEDATPEQQRKNEILQKIILPHTRGYARIEGSNFDAREFITWDAAAGDGKGIGREQFQQALSKRVAPQCQEVGLDIQAVTLGTIDLPPELTEQIAARDVARAKLERNKSQIEQYRTQQKLDAAKAPAQQAADKVEAQTRLSQAKTLAAQKKANQEQLLKNDLAVAQLQLEGARDTAKKTLATGKADADVISLNNEAEVAGLRKEVQGFPTLQAYAQYQILKKLAPALTEIFASDESDFAKFFAGYLTRGNNGTPPSQPSGNGDKFPMPRAGR